MQRQTHIVSTLVFTLLLTGAGCDWGSRIALPFKLPDAPVTPEQTSLSIAFRDGLKAELRPTVLGVSGTVDDLLGQENETVRFELRDVSATSSALTWTRDAYVETEASKRARAHDSNLSPVLERHASSGDVRLTLDGDDAALFLPAFWDAQREAPADSSAAWLSRDAYRTLMADGSTDLQLGVGDERIAAVAAAVDAFNAFAARLGGAVGASRTPFRFARGGEATFPIRIDGRVEFAAVVTAKSAWADAVILKNPDNPLVLKISFNPLALGALTSFSGLGIDPARLGYEITSLETP